MVERAAGFSNWFFQQRVWPLGRWLTAPVLAWMLCLANIAPAEEPVANTAEVPAKLLNSFHLTAIQLDAVFVQRGRRTNNTFSRTKIRDDRVQVEIVHGDSYAARYRDPVWSVMSIYSQHSTQYWRWRRAFRRYEDLSDGVKLYRNHRALDILGITFGNLPESVGTLPKLRELQARSTPDPSIVVFSSVDNLHRIYCKMDLDSMTIQPVARVTVSTDADAQSSSSYWRFTDPRRHRALLLPRHLEFYWAKEPLTADVELEFATGQVTPFELVETIKLSRISFDQNVDTVVDPIVEPGTIVLDSRSVPVAFYPGGEKLIMLWSVIVSRHAKTPSESLVVWITGLSLGIACLAIVLSKFRFRGK